jgi:hypothetical protein
MSSSDNKNEATFTAEADQTSLSFQSITEGFTSRDIPKVKFIEDIDAFSQSFDPPASAELMIGAFSDFFAKLKGVEGTLAQRGTIGILYCLKSIV